MHTIAEIVADRIRVLPGIAYARIIAPYPTNPEYLVDFSNGYFRGCLMMYNDYCTGWDPEANILVRYYYGDPSFPDNVLAETQHWALNKHS